MMITTKFVEDAEKRGREVMAANVWSDAAREAAAAARRNHTVGSAFEASDEAHSKNTDEAHLKAASLHRRAATEHSIASEHEVDKTKSDYHKSVAKMHNELSAQHEAAMKK